MATLFQDSVEYCMLSTRIEDAMAMSPLIVNDERKELDEALTNWYQTSLVHSKGMNEPSRITKQKRAQMAVPSIKNHPTSAIIVAARYAQDESRKHASPADRLN